jgi:hypothetical protein
MQSTWRAPLQDLMREIYNRLRGEYGGGTSMGSTPPSQINSCVFSRWLFQRNNGAASCLVHRRRNRRADGVHPTTHRVRVQMRIARRRRGLRMAKQLAGLTGWNGPKLKYTVISGWLGREDSNLRMAESKSVPF